MLGGKGAVPSARLVSRAVTKEWLRILAKRVHMTPDGQRAVVCKELRIIPLVHRRKKGVRPGGGHDSPIIHRVIKVGQKGRQGANHAVFWIIRVRRLDGVERERETLRAGGNRRADVSHHAAYHHMEVRRLKT